MPRTITATYRLQLRRDFPFAAARSLVPYFHKLGVSHLYLSPVLAARAGSPHGYDVIDPARVNPELGTDDDLRALAADLHAQGMGIILDIVPNHMAASDENPYWDDVLQRGRSSPFADWFDIDWDAPYADGKVVLPVLGDDLDRTIERGELTLHIRDSGARIAYFDKTFPLDPAARPASDEWAAGEEGKGRVRALLDVQHYRLASWRHVAKELNYRRFFDVNDLVALRMETDAVFGATHEKILAWVREGILDGLRVDHVDGLRVPSWYLATLRSAVDAVRHKDAPERFPIFVEKILTGDESLPAEWPVEGTTGYDFLNDVEELFLDPDGFRSIEANYRGLRHNPTLDFRAVARNGKRGVLNGALRPDVNRVARIAYAWRNRASVDEIEIANAIVELIVHLDVYRTYLSVPGIASDADGRLLTELFRRARDFEGVSTAALELLRDAFFADPSPGDSLRTELVTRFQQASGPAAAKGVEDTALYTYVPLASRNEIGGQPDRPLVDVAARVHARNAARSRDWPRTMLATNTHDTKRSADLRARLDALTARPNEWARHVSRWRKLNKPRKRIARGRPTPDTNSEYLFYQTLFGLWPAPRPERRVDDLPDRDWLARARDRLVAYMLKAVREAKTRTSWTEADSQFEKAVEAFVRETLEPHDDAPFLPDVARLTAMTADDGFRVALGRVLLHCTSPGTPDIYQGDEIWNFTLVDPDNRRLVDFDQLERLLGEIDSPDLLRGALGGSGGFAGNTVKLALLARLLRFRRDHPKLFADGDYMPLLTGSRQSENLFAFCRRLDGEACICIVRTRFGTVADGGAVEPLPNELAGAWHSVLTGRAIELVRVGPQLTVSVDELIAPAHPVELLLRRSG